MTSPMGKSLLIICGLLSLFQDLESTQLPWLFSSPINNQLITDNYRLPASIIPKHYTIEVTPFISENNFTFLGVVEIEATVVSSTNKVVLHIDEIVYEEITLSSGNIHLKPINITQQEKYNFLEITLASPLTAGTNVTIVVKYTGTLNAQMKGFYRSSYTDSSNNTRWLAATHLEPVAARKFFPCFDEPGLKATFQIKVARIQKFQAISNTPLQSTTKINDDLYLDTFEVTPIMSTYLVALVVSDFEFIEKNENFTVWARPNAVNLTEYSASVMKPIVDYFEGALNHSYQLPKLDMIALPDFAAGAMENWGLITYRESNMFYHPDHTPITSKQAIGDVIAHEIAHQWFGNMVSPAWWKFVWLSEGFARYFQYHATAKVETSWGLESQFVVEQLHTALDYDASLSTHPMSFDVSTPSEISGIFDSISYNKGGSVLRMMEKIVGSDVFYASLHDYLDSQKYSSATPEDLWAAFQSQANAKGLKLDIKTIMDTWTTQAGFPVVQVSIAGKVATLSQERFSLKTQASQPDKQLWSVPISWASKSSANFSDVRPTYWLATATENVTLSTVKNGDWVIFNLQEAGFYRVNYDSESWTRIIEVLKSKNFETIHIINRASLLDDLFNLARGGYLKYSVALSATQYLNQEINYIPWASVLRNLDYLRRQFSEKKPYELLKTHIVTILKPIHQKLSFNEAKEDNHYDKLLRRIVVNWLCKLDVEECIDEAKRLFKNWKINEDEIVPVNLRNTVYCTAIKYGTEEDYDFLKQKYSKIDVPAEKSVILSSLSCSQKSSNINELLQSAITKNSGFHQQDHSNIFAYVYNSGLFGAQQALDFIDKHHEEMYSYYGNYKKIASIINGISSQLSTEEQVLKLENFVNSHAQSLSEISDSLKSTLDQARAELSWYETYAPEIFQWLDETYPSADYRLPKTIKPLNYKIAVTPYLEGDFTFDGEVEIDMEAVENTSSIVMHANYLTIKELKVYIDPLKPLTVSNYSVNSTTHKFTIYLTTIVKAETIFYAFIKYSGILNDRMEGFYRSSYEDDEGNTRWLATTQFQKIGARQAFPCFDEPAFKATFEVVIDRPNAYHSLSNAPLIRSIPSTKANRTVDVYGESPIMSSYLVAFIVSDFESIKNLSSVPRVGVWSRPNAIEYAQEALETAQKTLSFLEEYTKVAYPLKKVDLAAIPDFAAGAMENWGLVTFREYGLLTSENVTSALYQKYMTTVVAHELVHMWFGNLVTCDWWEYIWLNEGFAEYLEWVVTAEIHPDWDAMQQFSVYELQHALLRDSFPYMRPMNNKMKDPYDDGKDFSSVAYAKSASVIHMMRNAFGKETFAKALFTYLDKHKYSTVKPEYLWSALQHHIDQENVVTGTDESVATLMSSWADQPGYPVVNATVYGRYLIISQERFLLNGRDTTNSNQLYWIPITITKESDAKFEDQTPTLWLGTRGIVTEKFNLTDEWFIINVQQTGYYRVNYDEKSWNKLISALSSDNFGGIPPVSRAQILDDLLNLARAGYIPYTLALLGTEYLDEEVNHLPWKVYFTAMTFLHERFDETETGGLMRKHTLMLVDKVYREVGFHERANDTFLTKLNRQLILTWVCKLEYSDCVETSMELFAQWRQNSSQLISPDAKPGVFCTALKHGNYSDWKFLWEQYLISNFESEKIIILNSLGCTLDKTALNEYLSIAISNNSSIRRQNIATVFASIYSADKFGVDVFFNFLMTNYTEIYNFYGNVGSVASLFSIVASKFSTKDQINQLENFMNSTDEIIVKMSKTLEEAIENAKENWDFADQIHFSIEEWLAPLNPPLNPSEPDAAKTTNPTFLLITFALIALLMHF